MRNWKDLKQYNILQTTTNTIRYVTAYSRARALRYTMKMLKAKRKDLKIIFESDRIG